MTQEHPQRKPETFQLLQQKFLAQNFVLLTDKWYAQQLNSISHGILLLLFMCNLFDVSFIK
jgi:hypothetical protein